MQINRLLEIVYILLDKKMITAKELSERFEVSQRTIYRDIDALSEAGIPVYANKGKGGGIRLLDNFVLNKSVLSEKEQIDILSALHGLNALNVPDIEPVLEKLGAMFKKNNENWIDVDFSRWGSDSDERKKFSLIKSAILNKKVITFNYFSTYGEKTARTLEPLKLIFKGQSWYIYGFCRLKKDFRLFKITRIKDLGCFEESFERDIPENIWSESKKGNVKSIKLVLKIDAKMSYRVYDEFEEENIQKNSDGSFNVTAYFVEDEWVYGYILSFGNYAEVLEPIHMCKIIKEKLEESLKKYI